MPPRRTGRAAKVASLDSFVVKIAWDGFDSEPYEVVAPTARAAALRFAARPFQLSGLSIGDRLLHVTSSDGRCELWCAPNAYRVEFHSCLRAGIG